MFRDRTDAGRRLASALVDYAHRSDAVVLGLPRGGVAVACEVAQRLHLPLDVYVVRKLGVPARPELAMGALAGDGTYVLDEGMVAALGIRDAQVRAVIAREREELRRRERAYRGIAAKPKLGGKTAILVDDGLATGATMRVAALAVRRAHPKEIVVAVPVGASRTCDSLHEVADRVVCPFQPEPFVAVGLFYGDFSQTTDEEVRRLLAKCTA
jgi:putative phosphoribosyl transferase